MTDDWKYQTQRVYLAPYNEMLANSFDGLLAHLYLRTKQDGLLGTAFPGLPDLNHDKFVRYLSGPKVVLQIYYLKPTPREDSIHYLKTNKHAPMTPIGYCFLYNVDGEPGQRLAEFGFCFFKEYWGLKETHELGWQCIAYWFEALGVDVLYGATLVDNFLARNFSRKFGFEEIAVMPKFLRSTSGRTDARIVLLERDKFLKLWYQRQEPKAA